MNITELTTRAGSDKRRRRVGRGRGSGCGKTSGRGHGGVGQRSGGGGRVLAEGGQMPTFRRLPKRGFSNANFTMRYSIVNVGELEARFEAGAHVTPQALMEKRLIRNLRFPVKILGDGDLTKKFTIAAAKYSRSAAEKIQAVGGEARLTV